ncbi:hypothetical protein KGQ20_28050 [Catenulispora sp. NF23]|uniref:Uncharacterized protein n=1 Tax=Catenulispora pinistramenti TaxID=2705254 RepID=A0ABS5L1M7_9ACTN|nr:hypothetical protein [Catenulispora pinistramenti]MBS2536620.1 hypothetical protein [Catenulispora pinistramenti]MBS2552237.1 hypothetical protein [Catenulispora pinistramenti]
MLLGLALEQADKLLLDRPEEPELDPGLELDLELELDLLRLALPARYELANIDNAAGVPDKAVTLLDKAEQECATLIAAGDERALPVLADVLSRRAYSLLLLGRGASAVVDSDRAVSLCRLLRRGGLTHDGDVGRLLAFNARILAEFGDVGLAMRSVRESGELLGELGEFQYAGYLPFLSDATDIVRTERSGSMNLYAALDAIRLDRTVPRRTRRLADQVTELARYNQAPGLEESATCPSERLGLSRCAGIGANLSNVAVAAYPDAPNPSTFLAREAHYLIAAAWSGSRPAGNLAGLETHLDGGHLAAWADAVTICMDACLVADNLTLHDDYAGWLETAKRSRSEFPANRGKSRGRR